jgi:hypothetical protein
VRLRKKGYLELNSRFGDFYELEQTSYADVKMLCNANGLEDENKIKTIAKNTTGDLRRVSTSIIAARIDEKRKIVA